MRHDKVVRATKASNNEESSESGPESEMASEETENQPTMDAFEQQPPDVHLVEKVSDLATIKFGDWFPIEYEEKWFLCII
uniref:Uncharacterized protein n=1 Tax=Romanomermis culicivorax TaxID=13658 RepID=A0A915IKX3_ROMCU